jgi:hypothetical protein
MKIQIFLAFMIGITAGVCFQLPKDNQLADHALYECSKPNKVVVTLRPAKDGDCEFVALGAE